MLKILTLFGSKISKNTGEGTVPSMKRASSAPTKTLVLAGTTSLLFLLFLMPVGGLQTVWAETFIGTDGDDSIDGTNEDDLIKGLGGDDELNGLDGNDQIKGGNGEDVIDGGEGDNSISGGKDDDEIVFRANGVNTIFGNKGNDLIDVGSDEGCCFGGNTIYGGKGDDIIRNARIKQLDLW